MELYSEKRGANAPRGRKCTEGPRTPRRGANGRPVHLEGDANGVHEHLSGHVQESKRQSGHKRGEQIGAKHAQKRE